MKTSKEICRIFIIDDHVILRQGLRYLIEHDFKFSVCGEAADWNSACPLIEATQPHLVLVDISLPGVNGIEVTKNIKAQFPHIRTLMLSMHEEGLYAERAIRAGASGYLMKEKSMDSLLEALHRILDGGIYLSSHISNQLLQSLGQNKGERPELHRLSDRELEVVTLLGMGRSSSEISKQLNISMKTVETHRGNVRRKLNLKSGAELVRFAASHNKTSVLNQ